MQTSYFSQGRSDEKKALFPTSTTSLHLPVIRSVYTLQLCENGGLVRQSVHQFICMSIYRSVGLSVGPSVHCSLSPWSRDAFSDSPNHLYKVVCPSVRPIGAAAQRRHMVSSFLDLLLSCCEVSAGSRAVAPIERKKERKSVRKKEKIRKKE